MFFLFFLQSRKEKTEISQTLDHSPQISTMARAGPGLSWEPETPSKSSTWTQVLEPLSVPLGESAIRKRHQEAWIESQTPTQVLIWHMAVSSGIWTVPRALSLLEKWNNSPLLSTFFPEPRSCMHWEWCRICCHQLQLVQYAAWSSRCLALPFAVTVLACLFVELLNSINSSFVFHLLT